jgi:hypothetical protein
MRGVFVTTFTALVFVDGVVEQALRIIATDSAIYMDFRIPPKPLQILYDVPSVNEKLMQ